METNSNEWKTNIIPQLSIVPNAMKNCVQRKIIRFLNLLSAQVKKKEREKKISSNLKARIEFFRNVQTRTTSLF